MNKLKNESKLSLEVNLYRDVYSDGDSSGHIQVISSITLEQTYWIDGGEGTYITTTTNTLMEQDQGHFVLVTNDDDTAQFDNWSEAKTELADRLASQIENRLDIVLDLPDRE